MISNGSQYQTVPHIIGVVLLLSLVGLWWTHNVRRGNKTQWIPDWQDHPAFQIPHRALAAVASCSHVYVIGGVDNNDQNIAQVE